MARAVAAASARCSRWVTPWIVETGAFAAAPEEYERRVTDFLDRALLGYLRSGSADGTR